MSQILEPTSELDPDGDIVLVVTNPSSTTKRNKSDPRNDGGKSIQNQSHSVVSHLN